MRGLRLETTEASSTCLLLQKSAKPLIHQLSSLSASAKSQPQHLLFFPTKGLQDLTAGFERGGMHGDCSNL